MAGHAGVPASATAVVLNLTATEPTDAGFLTAWPAGTDRPLASALNFLPGDNVANLVMVQLGPGGTLSLYQFGGTTHVVADVVGSCPDGAALRASSAPTRSADSVPRQDVLVGRGGFEPP